jgi:hypothetical protein
VATFRGTMKVVLDVENCLDEAQAKEAFIEDLGDFLRHNTYEDLIKITKLDDKPVE